MRWTVVPEFPASAPIVRQRARTRISTGKRAGNATRTPAGTEVPVSAVARVEEIAAPADKTGVGAFWCIDDSLLAPTARSEDAAAPSGGASQTPAPFLTQINQVLDSEAAPDAAFFVDSWTVGLAAASENFRRRQEPRTADCVLPWNLSWSLPPFFVAPAEGAAEPTWPLREARPQSALPDPRPHAELDDDRTLPIDDPCIAGPCTQESARRILGVTNLSTREQIRTAYRKLAARFHPDRLASRSLQEQKLAGDRMASINEAYRLLSAI